MYLNNDIYQISGRLKNILASADMALSPAGTVLINLYTHVLKSLYDFAESLPAPHNQELMALLLTKEEFPKDVIKLTLPKKNKSLYEQVMETKTQFSSNEEALEFFTQKYEEMGGDESWQEAESADYLDEWHLEIMRTARSIQMCRYLIEKEKNGE